MNSKTMATLPPKSLKKANANSIQAVQNSYSSDTQTRRISKKYIANLGENRNYRKIGQLMIKE